MNKCKNCGKECNNKYCSVSCQNIYSKIINEKKYNLNPSYCKNCGEQLDYYHRKSKFCNQSCSASFNNIGVCRNEKKTIKKKSGKTKGNYDLITDKEFILIINSCNSWKELSLKFHYKNIDNLTEKKSTLNISPFTKRLKIFPEDVYGDFLIRETRKIAEQLS